VYRVAGVATTFSPRFLAVLAEARRVSEWFAAPLHFIHAAEETADKNERFQDALARLDMERNTPISYRPGDPVEAILAVQKELGIEVLIAGALERETVHRNFTGNVARELMRRTCADLFLFVEPKDPPGSIRHIFMAVPDFSPLTRAVFHEAVQFGERAGAEALTVVHVQTPFSEAKGKALGTEAPRPEDNLELLLAEKPMSNLQFDYHLIRGNTGFTAFEFIQAAGADLLVMPSEIQPGGVPAFAPVLDWVIQVIPANLWVIRRPASGPNRG